MKSVNPPIRRGIIGGRTLVELIRSVLQTRIGIVAEVIDARLILETLLEEYFYGGAFQDDFYEQLSILNVPTDMIHFTRNEILTSIGQQFRLVFGDFRPCNIYSFQMLPSDDVCITEACPHPLRKPSSSETEYDHRH